MVPAWILDIFATIMLLVAAVSSGRLVAARPRPGHFGDSDIDAAHVLMGVAMAGMLASRLRTLPDGVWVAVFAVVTAWFAWRVAAEAHAQRASALSAGHHLPHLIHGAAMVYMFAAASTAADGAGSAMGSMGGAASSMGTLRLPTLGLVLVLLMAGWVVWDLDQLSGPRVRGTRTAGLSSGSLRLRVAAAATGPAAAMPEAAGAAFSTVPDAAGAGPAPAGTTTMLAESASAGPESARDRLLDPRIAVGCRIAMGVTMALMLVIMI